VTHGTQTSRKLEEVLRKLANTRDLAIAESVAAGAAKMIDEYLAEMRSQGRVHGELSVLVRDGNKRVRFQYRTPPPPSQT